MKRALLILFFACLLQMVKAQSTYQIYYGGPKVFTSPLSMTTDGTNYYFLQQIDSKTYLWKQDQAAQTLWIKSFDSLGMDEIDADLIEYKNGSIFISGGATSRDVVFLKADTSGNPEWIRTVDYGDINIVTAHHSTDNGIFQTGYRDFPTGLGFTYDITISRFTPDGNFLWSKAYGDNNYQYSNEASALTAGEGLIVAGFKGIQFQITNELFFTKFDSSGNQLWLKKFNPGTFFEMMTPDFVYNDGDSAYIIGCTARNTNFNYDAYVIRMDTSGTILWTKRFYQIGYHEYIMGMKPDNAGNFDILCRYGLQTGSDTSGYFMLKINRAGNILSSNSLSMTWGFNNFERTDVFTSGSGYMFRTWYYNYANFQNYDCLISTDQNFQIPCSAYNGTYSLSFVNGSMITTNEFLLSAVSITANGSMTTSFTSEQPFAISDLCTLTSLSELKNDVLEIYPNPATDKVNIRLTESSTINIMDISGRQVFSGQYEKGDAMVDVSHLTSGVYVVKCGDAVKRMVIE